MPLSEMMTVCIVFPTCDRTVRCNEAVRKKNNDNIKVITDENKALEI